MRYANSNSAVLFWLVFALILFFVWARKSKRKALSDFIAGNLLDYHTKAVNFKFHSVKKILIIAAVFFSVIALMRPQWGYQWQEIKRKGLDILIAIDTSKSMLAADVKPNRLERSKLAVKDLIRKLKGDRIGLIAFSGMAYLQCPLTVDYDGFLLALDDLNIDTIPRGGTSISSAVKTAMKSYEGGQKKYKILVIITDGEDHEGGIKKLAEKAKEDNIKIFGIGIGTADGELIQVADDRGGKVFLKDKAGNVVKSRLNERTLREISLITGAAYVKASGAEFGLDLIYEEKLSKMERRELKAEMSKRYNERFQIPLALALLLLAAEPLIGDRKK